MGKELDHIDLNKIQSPAVAMKTRFLQTRSRRHTIVVSVDVVKCFVKQRCFPPLGSKLVFHAKFVKKKKIVLFCQPTQLVYLEVKNQEQITGGPHVVRCQTREICQTITYHLLVKINKKRYVSVNVRSQHERNYFSNISVDHDCDSSVKL